jgi:hypothetical protein
MTMIRTSLAFAAAVMAMATLGIETASAQATRTWVSGVGDDANPCSRTAPCKTFAGTISKTASGGEIDCLDPGGFGALTITKPITVDCNGVTGGVLASLVNGIIINATQANAHVVLRNLSINGVGNGLDGVRILASRFVTLENVTITGFAGDGIEVLPAAGTSVGLDVINTTIGHTNTGINITGAGGISVAADNLNVVSSLKGIDLSSSIAFVSVANSTFHQLTDAAIGTSAGTGTIAVAGSLIARNTLAFRAASAGSQIRISDNTIVNNVTGFTITAGAIATAGNNMIEGNGGSTVPNASFNLK